MLLGALFLTALNSAARSEEGRRARNSKVYALIEGYRTYGHLLADFNPMATKKGGQVPELELKHFGFNAKDLGQMVPTCGFLKEKECPLQTLIDALKKTYCNRIGDRIHGPRQSTDGSMDAEKIEPLL